MLSESSGLDSNHDQIFFIEATNLISLRYFTNIYFTSN